MRPRFTLFILCSLAVSGCDNSEKTQTEIASLRTQLGSVQAELVSLRGEAARLRSSVNSCFLDAMKGVSDQRLTGSIKAACIRLHEAPLPKPEIQNLRGTATFGPIYGHLPQDMRGLLLRLNIGSEFTITELTISIVNERKKLVTYYSVRQFPAPTPNTVEALFPDGPPSLGEVELTPGFHAFTVPIGESVDDAGKFFETYSWSVVAAKGYVD